jgi:outer membrane protein assembly factor BamB
MATLEVHDGQGRVERVVVSRDQTVLFGSSPKCEIVLAGEGIFPFHGRLRWNPRKQRFKADASPDAQFLVVNGHRMSSSSFRLGDEIDVGGNRIFLIHDGDQSVAEVAPRDDVTRVQPPPFLAPPAPPSAARRGGRPRPGSLVSRSLEDDLDAVVMELETPGRGGDEVAPPRSAARPRDDRRQPPPKRGWKRLLFLLSNRATAPGREQVMSSPLVFGLFVSFVFLVLTGFALYGIIVRSSATRLYNRGVENLEDGDYRNAIRRFDEFLRANPDDPRSGPARVHRAMADVRQYTTGAGASWSMALEAERRMADGVGKEPAFRDASTELAEQIIKTGENLADRAKLTADPKVLAEAESCVVLHERVAGASAETFFRRSRLPVKLEAARAAVRKAEVRARALAAMDAALEARSSNGVYAARDGLVAAYADLAEDRDLLGRMTGANELIRRAVTIDPSGRPAETEPRAEAFGPPTSLVLRSTPENGPPPGASPNGPMVFALADGFASGLDGATGAPVWTTPVGLSSPFPPQAIPGGTSALVFDARHDELLRLDARTGKLVWRQALGEPISDPPLVLGNQLVQPTPGGNLLLIDLPGGALQGTIRLGQALSGTPVSDETGQALYVTALKDCLFVVTRDPLGCVAVEYLGHAAGSIVCSPARLGRYLVVAENHQFEESRWRVFVVSEDGQKLTPVQQVPVRGWTWCTPASSGAVIWAAADRGGVTAYAIGAYTEKEPFRLIARISPDENPSGPAFAIARSERELWVGSGRSARYDLDPEASKLSTGWTMGDAGPAVAAPQTAGPLLVLSQEYTEGPGVALWGVDPQTGAARWRTALGTAWPLPLAPTPAGDGLATVGFDGAVLALPRDALLRGGFVTAALPRPGAFRIPAGALARLQGEGWTAIAPTSGSNVVLVRAGTSGPFKEVRMPAPVGARPVAWGREMFLPGGDGRAYLVDPLTGESRSEPFVPPFDRSRPTSWRAAVALGTDAVALADDVGRVRRLSRVSDPRPRLVVTAEAALGKELVSDPASTASAVVAVTADGRVRALSARDLSPIGAWTVDAPLSVPLASASGRVFVADVAGSVLAIGPDGQRLWSVKLPGGCGLAGPPAVRGAAVWLLTRNGTLHARSLSDGAELARNDLHVLPAGGTLALGDDLAVPVGRGVLRPLAIERVAPRPNQPGSGKAP